MADTTVEICHCISLKFNDQKSVTIPENLVVKDSVHAKKNIVKETSEFCCFVAGRRRQPNP